MLIQKYLTIPKDNYSVLKTTKIAVYHENGMIGMIRSHLNLTLF